LGLEIRKWKKRSDFQQSLGQNFEKKLLF